MKARLRLTVFAAAFLLSSPLLFAGGNPEGAPEDASPPSSRGGTPSVLAGTAWRLVSFQSMDDAVGDIRPEDPSVFTIAIDKAYDIAYFFKAHRTGR